MALISDPFDAMVADVQALPSGWTGSAKIPRTFSHSPGGIYTPHKWYEGNDQTLNTPIFSTTIQTSTFWGVRFRNDPPGTILAFKIGSALVPGTESTLATVVIEQDMTISLYCANNKFISNSGSGSTPFSLNVGVWYFFQLNLTVSISGAILHVDLDLAVDGIHILSASKDTDTGAADVVGLGIDQVTFESTTASDLSQITVESLVPINTYPNPGTPLIRVSQVVVETAAEPTTAKVRISQLVNEIAKRPSTAKIRISQLVIEVATQGVPATSGWQIYEA